MAFVTDTNVKWRIGMFTSVALWWRDLTHKLIDGWSFSYAPKQFRRSSTIMHEVIAVLGNSMDEWFRQERAAWRRLSS